jgi:hypothetical protein
MGRNITRARRSTRSPVSTAWSKFAIFAAVFVALFCFAAVPVKAADEAKEITGPVIGIDLGECFVVAV